MFLEGVSCGFSYVMDPVRHVDRGLNPFCALSHITKSSKAHFPHFYNGENYIIPGLHGCLKSRECSENRICKKPAHGLKWALNEYSCGCNFPVFPLGISLFSFSIYKSCGSGLRFIRTPSMFQ